MSRTNYFRRRRLRLLRRHRCTRCGGPNPSKQHRLCPDCRAVNVVKKSATLSPEKIKEAKRKRLLERLDMIEAARGAVLMELDRVA